MKVAANKIVRHPREKSRLTEGSTRFALYTEHIFALSPRIRCSGEDYVSLIMCISYNYPGCDPIFTDRNVTSVIARTLAVTIATLLQVKIQYSPDIIRQQHISENSKRHCRFARIVVARPCAYRAWKKYTIDIHTSFCNRDSARLGTPRVPWEPRMHELRCAMSRRNCRRDLLCMYHKAPRSRVLAMIKRHGRATWRQDVHSIYLANTHEDRRVY